MNEREFMGHCICDSRYKKILMSIATDPLNEVKSLYEIHKKLKKNFKFNELEDKFKERFAGEQNGK